MPGINLAQYGPSILYFVIIIAVFYFILIRPQKKKDKEHKNLLSSLKKGDQIVTIGGFHGKVISLKNEILTVQIGDNKAKIETWAVKEVVKSSDKDETLIDEAEIETETEN